MATSAQAGTVSFGPQAAKGSVATNFYRHRATLVDIGVNDAVTEGVPEVGGIPVPSFIYKSGPIVAGGFTLMPRLEDTIGWLLYGALGDVSSVEQPGSSGIYNHTFTIKTGDETYVPWMSFRKQIPKRDGLASTDLGELYTDGKILSFGMTLPNDSPITTRVDALAREFELDHDPTLWSYANTFESWESVPVGCQTGGYLKIDGVELPVVAATVGWANVPLDIRMEKVFGDPYIDGVTIVSRRMVYDFTIKWNDPDLYALCLTNSTVGTVWDSAPQTASFEVKTVSSLDMAGESEPYSLIVAADEVNLNQVGGVRLAGNQAVILRFAGVALEATNYASFTLRNKVASYTWPTPASGSGS